MTTENENMVPEMSGEQLSAFASLQSKAEGQIVPGDPVEEVEEVSMPAPLAEQISGMLAMVVGVAGPIFPSLNDIYTPEAIERVGVAMQPLCEKHGWLQDGIAGKYGEELMALIVMGPLAYATYAGIAHDIASRKPKKEIKPLEAPVPGVPAESVRRSGDSNPGEVTIGKVIPA